jgi:hypothetical protein
MTEVAINRRVLGLEAQSTGAPFLPTSMTRKRGQGADGSSATSLSTHPGQPRGRRWVDHDRREKRLPRPTRLELESEVLKRPSFSRARSFPRTASSWRFRPRKTGICGWSTPGSDAAKVVLPGEVLKRRWRGPTPPLRVTLGMKGGPMSSSRQRAAPVTRHAITLVAWYRSYAGGAYDSHHRTAGIACRTRRCGAGLAACCASL